MRRSWAERVQDRIVEAASRTIRRKLDRHLVLEVAPVGTVWVSVEERVFSVQFPGWFAEVLSCGHDEFGFFVFSRRCEETGSDGMRVCRQCSSAGEKHG